MKAALIHEVGPPEQIIFEDLPTPTPQRGEVLIRVGAVAVNPIDTYIRGGAVSFDFPLPYIVGCDFAGTIVACGEGVKEFQIGERVWGSNQGIFGRQGTFAEVIAVPIEWIYRTPDDVRDEDAAAQALVGITAHLGLFQRAQLQAGETVLVNGGSGGVGASVIQLARAQGARVIATAGSEEKRTACIEWGAELAIDYRQEGWEKEVKELAPQGVHLLWDTTRDPDLDRDVDLLARGGRMILMAGRDARPPFPVGPFYSKSCTLLGLIMFAASAAEQRICGNAISDALASGALSPRIDRVLPLTETADAHRIQEEATIHGRGQLFGKIVLIP
ncbi:MAG: NADPH:quinone reductase [Pirellulales bacterium]|nr:NADPH:quinone reductase [Pirellulales bacterium]